MSRVWWGWVVQSVHQTGDRQELSWEARLFSSLVQQRLFHRLQSHIVNRRNRFYLGSPRCNIWLLVKILIALHFEVTSINRFWGRIVAMMCMVILTRASSPAVRLPAPGWVSTPGYWGEAQGTVRGCHHCLQVSGSLPVQWRQDHVRPNGGGVRESQTVLRLRSIGSDWRIPWALSRSVADRHLQTS